ncbi:cadherin domain-containing protein, partial [Laspinema olomoucense]
DDTLPGNQPDDTLPGNQPDDTLPGNQPDDTLPGNQAPTNIILSNTSIAENSANGAIIAALSTVDPDAGDPHTYTLIDNAGGRFTLSGNQLAVANGTLLDFETTASHGIILQTTDSEGNTFDKPFTISVTDVNEETPNNAPTDIALSNSVIDENRANGTAIGTLTTADPDAGDIHSYSLVDNAGGRFAIAGNQLTVANGALLDFETANTYNIVVRTTDAAGQTFNKTLAVTVNNVNEVPTDLAVSNLIVAENSANGSLIGTITPTDPDTTDTHTYTLLDNAGGRFAISKNQLTVANGSLLDYETATIHNITLRTTDAGGNNFDKAFTVTVSNVNETIPNNAPTDISVSNITLAENSSNGTILGDLATVDPDAADTHSYSLVDNAGGRFAISGSQITLADGTLLDYETGNSHPITVRTTDAGGLTFDKTFTLSVTNLNEMPTDMGVSNTVVNENSSNGTAIANLTTTDPDTADTYTYSLVDNAGGRFGISGNQLTVANGTLLDYETGTSHPIILRSTDAGGLSIDKNFVITLNNVNDPPVLVRNSPLSVTQGGIVGITNSLLQVTDQDNTPGQLTYTLVNAPANGQLRLESTPLFVNDTFTQADIDSTPMRYTHGLIQLSNNSNDDYNPQISGSSVVWSGSEGTDNEVYFYDGTSTTQLTNNSTDDYNPQISGSNVVWFGFDGTDNEIYFSDGTSTIQLTNNSTDDYSNQISGSNVVWYGFDGTDNEIYFYNGTSTIQLTNNSTDDSNPQISGSNVVWQSFDGTDNEIYFYDGNSTIQLTNNSTDDYNPQISGSNVVWQNYDGIDVDIYFHDGNNATTAQVTNNNSTENFNPQISGSNVVWYHYDGTDEEIYFYDGNNATTTQLTNNSITDWYPQISGSNVVWYGFDGTDNEIYFYDGTSTTQLTNNSTDDSNPQISGSNVVWYGSDGTDNEIYFSPMAGTSMSDSLMFTVSDGIGGVLGATTFNVNVI